MSDQQCISGHDCWRFTNEMAAVIDAARAFEEEYRQLGDDGDPDIAWALVLAVRALEERTDQ